MKYNDKSIKQTGRTCLRLIRVLANGTDIPYAVINVNKGGKYIRWAEREDINKIPAIYSNAEKLLGW